LREPPKKNYRRRLNFTATPSATANVLRREARIADAAAMPATQPVFDDQAGPALRASSSAR